jgi:hypothetical protein
VGSVLALHECRHFSIPSNRWYSFLKWGSFFTDWSMHWHREGRHFVADSAETVPVFNPIPAGTPRFIRFYADNPQDYGKNITVYGVDSNGQALGYGQRLDNTWQDGLVLSLSAPYIQSSATATWDGKVHKITRVVKDPTVGRVRGFQVDDAGVQYDMATYEPSETNPDYVWTRVPVHNDGRPTVISALVKLAFVPVQYDNDLVLIENVDALRDMVMSIKAKEAGGDWLTPERAAFRELNFELRDRFPMEQFPLDFRPFGDDTLRRQKIGSLI